MCLKTLAEAHPIDPCVHPIGELGTTATGPGADSPRDVAVVGHVGHVGPTPGPQ